ncbi:MAG TPA: hypothetical protein VD994_10455 [Prosthecobacter sp.]|nr:hypothetical protein [Prosthecobacter sp.]
MSLGILALLAGCKTITTDRFVYPEAPVAYQFVSEMVDEETIEHSVKFRNIGQTVVSFDYTLANEPGVPHMDCLGPNSGLVENLYPGAEVQVKNPLRQMKHVYVTLGRITHGKRTGEELAKTYKPSTIVPAGTSAPGATPLPVLEPVNVPGE